MEVVLIFGPLSEKVKKDAQSFIARRAIEVYLEEKGGDASPPAGKVASGR